MNEADEPLLGAAGQDTSDASLQRLVRPALSEASQHHHGATATQVGLNLHYVVSRGHSLCSWLALST